MVSVTKQNAAVLLKSVIKKRNIRQKDLANAIGVSPKYMSQILTGRKNLSSTLALKASKWLDLPLDFFLNV